MALRSAFPTSPALISSVSDLFEFICSGPLMKRLGLTAESVAESIDKWLETGVHLCQLFRLNELSLSLPEKIRIYHFYVPVFLWCEDQLTRHRSILASVLPKVVEKLLLYLLLITFSGDLEGMKMKLPRYDKLELVNENLKAYYNAWDKFIEAWIIIKIQDPNCVYQWRLQVNHIC
ncbi:hypothetical protein BHE74_00000851 [Ensete ventricosum]|nr:hypothetical protein BHE74_00000851 [Ensete ventricosum]RZR78551.1 hypothetical protein BHM03_00003966 [Ensete ventricosum]